MPFCQIERVRIAAERFRNSLEGCGVLAARRFPFPIFDVLQIYFSHVVTSSDFEDVSYLGFLVSLAARLIASWINILAFYHQDYGAFRRPCAMLHALGHDESLTRSKIDGAILEIDH